MKVIEKMTKKEIFNELRDRHPKEVNNLLILLGTSSNCFKGSRKDNETYQRVNALKMALRNFHPELIGC